jgi:hypothetical protein
MTGLAAPFLADSSRAGAFLEATPSACGRVAAKLEHGDGGAEHAAPGGGLRQATA